MTGAAVVRPARTASDSIAGAVRSVGDELIQTLYDPAGNEVAR
jgi:hypothetical protein